MEAGIRGGEEKMIRFKNDILTVYYKANYSFNNSQLWIIGSKNINVRIVRQVIIKNRVVDPYNFIEKLAPPFLFVRC